MNCALRNALWDKFASVLTTYVMCRLLLYEYKPAELENNVTVGFQPLRPILAAIVVKRRLELAKRRF